MVIFIDSLHLADVNFVVSIDNRKAGDYLQVNFLRGVAEICFIYIGQGRAEIPCPLIHGAHCRHVHVPTSPGLNHLAPLAVVVGWHIVHMALSYIFPLITGENKAGQGMYLLFAFHAVQKFKIPFFICGSVKEVKTFPEPGRNPVEILIKQQRRVHTSAGSHKVPVPDGSQGIVHLADLGAAAHCKANVRLFKCRGVVYAVACHTCNKVKLLSYAHKP